MGWEKLIQKKHHGGIGFRDLAAKYYPNDVLTDTAFIKNSSPTWQGITHCLELLKKGLVWGIVNGKRIHIWRDNWLARGNHKVSGNPTGSRLRWVQDLIDPKGLERATDQINFPWTRR
jgi:hypothetical protein